jgi:outer membrane protein OmpA-like peptidoglycan-associated protein
VEKGVEESKIEIFSYGTTLPAKDCGDEKGRALIECLAPNRRVVLEVTAR